MAFPLHLFHLSPGIIPVLIVCVADCMAGLTVWHGNQRQCVGPGARLISDHKRCLVSSSPDDGAVSGEITARDSCRVSSTSWILTISSFTIFPESISIVWPLCVCVCVLVYVYLEDIWWENPQHKKDILNRACTCIKSCRFVSTLCQVPREHKSIVIFSY